VSIAQRALDGILEGSPDTTLGRARLKAAIEARKLMIRFGDPVVRCRIGDAGLELPLSHELPFYRQDHPLYGEAVGRIAAALGGPVVDIGANVGDTLAIVRLYSGVPVLCVEGDDVFFDLLQRNAATLGDVELERAFVRGSEPRTGGYVARARGTARVVAGEAPLETTPLASILEEHPRFARPALIKTDTDGMDVPIILANLDLLERLRPALFFEYDPHLGAAPEVFVALCYKGYSEALVFENTGEFRESVALRDEARLAALHREYTGHGGARYVDVCAVREEHKTAVNGLLATIGGARPLG
jgi:FkbM family methyltransferase